MRRGGARPGILVVLACITGLLVMVQPSYFFANPSRYALFSALVADRGVTVEREVPFATSPHPRLRLDVYRPALEDNETTRPIILFLYGGSWRDGDRAIYGFVGAALAARGFTTVIPDYRLFPDVQFPTFFEDAAAAYVWTSKHFSATGGQRRPIIVMGHSAGAHSAAMIALNPAYIRSIDPGIPMPDGLIGLAGPYAFDLTTFPATEELFRPGQNPDETIPAWFVTADAPPSLLIHGTEDTTVKVANQTALSDALRVAGVPVDAKSPAGLTHVGLIRAFAWPFRLNTNVLDDVAAFAEGIGTHPRRADDRVAIGGRDR